MSRPKRKVVLPHIILLVEGRLLMLLELAVDVYLSILFIQDVLSRERDSFWILMLYILFLLAMFVLTIFVFSYFWPLCFGELILTKDAVSWRCLGMRSVKISYADLHYVDIRTFSEGNTASNGCNTGFQYVLLSSKTLPNMRVDKIRCKDGLIKFQLLDRTALALYEYLPEPYCRMFCIKAETYLREKKREKRKKERKKQKKLQKWMKK